MIHATYTTTAETNSKRDAAENLIAFWEEKDIYMKNDGYTSAFIALGFIAGVILVDTPFKTFIHLGMGVILILMIVSYWRRRKSDKTNTPIEDPIEHLRLQKEKMITRRSKNLKALYIGIPLVLLASLSNFYFFKPDVVMIDIVFSVGITLLIGVAGIFFNRTLYAQPLEDADKVLSLED